VLSPDFCLQPVGQKAGKYGCIFSELFFSPENATCRKQPLSHSSRDFALNTFPPSAAQELDRADVSRVLAGDVQAFAGIVRRWQGPLVNMAWRYCRDRGRAEEMAQEAFIRAWRGLAQWRREGSFSTWLFALAANVYRTELKRFPTETLPLDDAPEPSSPASQHRDLAAQLSQEMVRRAVLALPTRYREPVILYYFHEQDVAAAARNLGLPEGTVKARLSRARALLRQRFPKLEREYDAIEASALNAGKEVIN
jgi:RNA polymerase sigma-70 factor (ECF subfamily)